MVLCGRAVQHWYVSHEGQARAACRQQGSKPYQRGAHGIHCEALPSSVTVSVTSSV